MRKYYTRPCNFYYGSEAKFLIKNKKAYSLTGNVNIAFDQIEIFQRKSKSKTVNVILPISSINKLSTQLRLIVKKDLKKITSRRKNIYGIDFLKSNIMGVLNITPDSFSDGGLFFNQSKAYKQSALMIDGGAALIDIGGESTRPGSKTVKEKDINDMVLSGVSPKVIEDTINKNKFSGLSAKMALSDWSKVSG